MTAKMDVTKSRMMSADDTGARAAAHSLIERKQIGESALGSTLAELSIRAVLVL